MFSFFKTHINDAYIDCLNTINKKKAVNFIIFLLLPCIVLLLLYSNNSYFITNYIYPISYIMIIFGIYKYFKLKYLEMITVPYLDSTLPKSTPFSKDMCNQLFN